MKNGSRRRKVKSRKGMIVPVPFTAFIALFAMTGLFYLWLCNRNQELGLILKEAEMEQVVLERRFQNESLQWANLCAPDNLEQALKKHGLTMEWPAREQIVRLYDVDMERSYTMVGLRPPMR